MKRSGRKSAAQTPAPQKERVFGSKKNPKGSAASKASAKGIALSQDIVKTLSEKAKAYNKGKNKKVSTSTLKAVMRRGMGAYSKSHRPTITGGAPNSRQAWGFARVNKFLKKKSGEPVKKAYVQDDDLLKKGGMTKTKKDKATEPKGNCYQAAAELLLYSRLKPKLNKIDYVGKPYLVHAEVGGQGPLEGMRFGHAWVEDDEWVYDFSNNKERVLPKQVYYLLGRIDDSDPKKYRKYTFEQAREKILSTMHYGCWDIETQYAAGGSVKPVASVEELAAKYGVEPDFVEMKIKDGTKEEYEHTTDRELARKIATHHVAEDIDYYQKLRMAMRADEGAKLKSYYAAGGETNPCETIVDGVRQIDPESIRKLTECSESLPQTKTMHTDEDGEYKPYRKALHRRIINGVKDGLICIERDQPIAILMGGSPASGKSTFLKKSAPYLLGTEILKIDADEIRAQLPEYRGYNATQTHMETKDIVNTLLSDRTIGVPCRFDVIYDGTMNNTKSYIPLINLLKDQGYKIFIVYIDRVPEEVVKDRALKRYQKSGRFVPMSVIDDFFSKGTAALEQLKKEVDGYMVVDGSSGDYKVIEQGGMKLPKDRQYSRIGTPIEVSTEEVVVEMKWGGKLYEKGGINPDDPATKGAVEHRAGAAGGLLVGKRHSEGGIKAVNKSTGQPLEMEGGEVVITRNAVSDNKKREFEGEMLTNREILSRINVSGGGVSFDKGGKVPKSCACTGKSYKYGGKTMTDREIVLSMYSPMEKLNRLNSKRKR